MWNWDAESGHQPATRRSSPRPGRTRWHSPEDLLASAGYDMLPNGPCNTVRMWDVGSGRPAGEPLVGQAGAVLDVAFNRYRRGRLASVGWQVVEGNHVNTLRVWDIESGQLIGDPRRPSPPRSGTRRGVSAPTDSFWPARATTARCRGVERRERTVPHCPAAGPRPSVRCGVQPRRTGLLASADDAGKLRVWNADTGQPLIEPLTTSTGQPYAVTFSPDGRLLASAGEGVQVWDVRATPDMLCNKLTRNMSRNQWREWISEDIEYRKLCEDLPVRGHDRAAEGAGLPTPKWRLNL